MASSNYAYAATRARVRRSKLLKPEAYRHLMAMEVVEITRYIQELDYREDVDKYASLYRGLDLIEVALASNLRRSSATILSFCKGKLAEQVEHYLERHRVRDIVRVIRGVYAREAPETILAGMFTTSSRDRALFTRLANAGSLSELGEMLTTTPYHDVVGELLSDKLDTLQQVEDALDCYYYAQLVEHIQPNSRADKLLLEFLRREIDVVNLNTVVRLRHRGVAGYSELLIEGGAELSANQLAATSSVEDIMTVVEQTNLGQAVAEELAGVGELGLNPLALALDQYLAEGASRFSKLYPLSVLPVVDYLLAKEHEVANLRTLARGKELNIPTPELEQMLVVS